MIGPILLPPLRVSKIIWNSLRKKKKDITMLLRLRKRKLRRKWPHKTIESSKRSGPLYLPEGVLLPEIMLLCPHLR